MIPTLTKEHIQIFNSKYVIDLTDRSQALKACHYTNYQPLWASDNLVKSAKDKKMKAALKLMKKENNSQGDY